MLQGKDFSRCFFCDLQLEQVICKRCHFQVQQKEKTDEEVAQAINQKLGDAAGISYSEIASKACDCGRTELAIKVSVHHCILCVIN